MFAILTFAVTSLFAHASDDASLACTLALMAPKIEALENSPQLKIERVSISNLAKTHAAAALIFPGDQDSVHKSYLASLIPRRILPVATKVSTSIRLERLEYYSLQDHQGEVLGVTGLYAVRDSGEAWIGWYGMSAAARGRGLGKTLLYWTIKKARDQGYKTVRLWTTSEPEYETANVIYQAMGFSRQDTGLVDPDHGNASLLLYSLSLTDEPVKPFAGSIKEALLGASDEDIARMKKR